MAKPHTVVVQCVLLRLPVLVLVLALDAHVRLDQQCGRLPPQIAKLQKEVVRLFPGDACLKNAQHAAREGDDLNHEQIFKPHWPDLLTLFGASLVSIDLGHSQQSFRLHGFVLLELGICQPGPAKNGSQTFSKER